MTDMPSRIAAKTEWIRYAIEQGADREELRQLTKQEIIDQFGQQRRRRSEAPQSDPVESEVPSDQSERRTKEPVTGTGVADDAPLHAIEAGVRQMASNVSGVEAPEQTEPPGAYERLPGEAVAPPARYPDYTPVETEEQR